KGRTPVLVSKMVHGDDREKDQDWNNDRNDIKNLVAFASKALFKRQPLAWQVFDGFRGIAGRKGETPDERILNVTSELLQSPVPSNSRPSKAAARPYSSTARKTCPASGKPTRRIPPTACWPSVLVPTSSPTPPAWKCPR